MCFIGMQAWEGYMFWGDDPMVNGHVLGDVVSREMLGDLGGDWELGDSEGRRPI